MKKLLLLLSLCLTTLSFTAPLQDHRIDPVAFSQLAEALDIPKTGNLLDETQKRWLRKPTQERWEIPELSPNQKLIVIHWAKEQGMYSPWLPASQSYDKALILGATTPRMQMRLNHLKQIWEEGIRFNEIVWLTGDRPLDKNVDRLLDRCNNESEAAHILWEETDLPQGMRHLPVTFVAVPMKDTGRPNTEDTLHAWLKIDPTPCKALFVSDQPFCGYQFAIIEATLPETYLFDVIGKGADPTSHPAAAAITLDSIARWYYLESLNR